MALSMRARGSQVGSTFVVAGVSICSGLASRTAATAISESNCKCANGQRCSGRDDIVAERADVSGGGASRRSAHTHHDMHHCTAWEHVLQLREPHVHAEPADVE
jgi:hypothetical protein